MGVCNGSAGGMTLTSHLNASALARLAGVSRQVISKQIAQYGDTPPPDTALYLALVEFFEIVRACKLFNAPLHAHDFKLSDGSVLRVLAESERLALDYIEREYPGSIWIELNSEGVTDLVVVDHPAKE